MVTRRSLIKGAIAAGASVSATSYLFRNSSAARGQPSTAGTADRLLTLNINGRRRHADVPKYETLAITLRDRLGLTGTKTGCQRAECGSCTVLIDDVPHYACSILTHSVRDRRITTIEGLATNGALHPVQQAVVDEQGFQCGFCAPGFIMATVGFLKTNVTPTRDELAEGISGNLCRCQDYDKILTAMTRAAEYSRRS
jgi:aerobic-type carbon monoxide dehydrogenase small subunit (CoxS/CutS family)